MSFTLKYVKDSISGSFVIEEEEKLFLYSLKFESWVYKINWHNQQTRYTGEKIHKFTNF